MLILLIQARFTVVYSKWDLFMNLQDVKETRKLIIFWIHFSSTLFQATRVCQFLLSWLHL